MIKNIVFDMGGVLISFDAQRYTARFVPNPADYELIRRELFRSVAVSYTHLTLPTKRLV